jgi:hypothetical protein
VAREEFLSINFTDLTEWNVWDFVLKTTVNINVIVGCPARVSESLNGVELVPFARLGVIDLKWNNFSDLVSSTTDDHHEWSQEKGRVLISWNRTISLTLIWSLDPIPSSVSMSTETPSVEQAALISGSTTEADHHTSGTSGLAQSCRVIDSDLWSFSAAIKLNPRERSFLNTETPHVIYSLLSGITTKNEQMRFRKYD